MKNHSKIDRVTLAELARRSGYSRQAIQSWTTAGVLRRANGTYALLESLEAIKRHESDRATDGSHDLAELRGLRRELLEKKIELLTHEIAVARGTVHDKTACCQSLMAIHSAESRIMHGMASRLASRYPEVNGLSAAISAETDSVLAALKSGTAYDVAFTCPHCRQVVKELVAVESQEVAA